MENIKDFFEDFGIIGAIMSLIIILFIGMMIDGLCCSKYEYKAIVVDKHYKAEESSVGTGTAYTSKGMAVVTTYQHSDEEYLLIVKDYDGNITTVKCEANLYYDKKVNQEVDCYNKIGFFTKMVWSRYAFQ